MTFVTAKELHDRTSQILRAVTSAKPVFVTRNGSRWAVIRGLSAADLDALVMLHAPTLRRELDEAVADVATGRAVSLDEAITQAEVGRPVHL